MTMEPEILPTLAHRIAPEHTALLIIDMQKDRWCQANANQSPNARPRWFSGRQLTPLRQRGRAVLLEDVAAVQMAVEIEVIVDRGVG